MIKIEINRADGLLISRALLELIDRILENAEMLDKKSVLYEDCILQAGRCRVIDFKINEQLNKE